MHWHSAECKVQSKELPVSQHRSVIRRERVGGHQCLNTGVWYAGRELVDTSVSTQECDTQGESWCTPVSQHRVQVISDGTGHWPSSVHPCVLDWSWCLCHSSSTQEKDQKDSPQLETHTVTYLYYCTPILYILYSCIQYNLWFLFMQVHYGQAIYHSQ